MSDIALTYDATGCDLVLAGNDLKLDEGLNTAIIISLFSDRRARSDDPLPSGDGDRRGWWADAYPVIEGDQIGSRLWLLSREKEIPETLRRAKEYAAEALAWLVSDGIAARVEVIPSVPRRGVLGLSVAVHKLDGNIENFQYEFLWGAF